MKLWRLRIAGCICGIILGILFAHILHPFMFPKHPGKQLQFEGGYCTNGTTANIVLRNMGKTNLVDLTCSKLSANTAECGPIRVERQQGNATFNPSFSSTIVHPGATVKFIDAGCAIENEIQTCAYDFLLNRRIIHGVTGCGSFFKTRE